MLHKTFAIEHPVALVTGSGSPRVGRAIVFHLASLGFHIALHANTSVDGANEVANSIQKEHNTKTLVTQGNLEDSAVPDRLVSESFKRFGRLDVLVNSAAIWHPTTLDEITADEVKRYFEINTLASFLAARSAAKVMADQESGGSIINIGDWATVRPYLDHAAYFPSKGAIETMTRSLAVEFAQMNNHIRVNCIQPGPVLLADEVPEEKARQIASTTLVQRVGTAEHIAHAVQFLCENDFVNGVCLPVDGGRSIFAPDGIQVGMNTG